MTEPWLLAADIGGTNVRLCAFQGAHKISSVQHETSVSAELDSLFGAFADSVGGAPAMVVAAAAGPVQNNSVRLTNAPKSLSGADLQKATGAPDACVINDFVAAAWATAHLEPQDVVRLQGPDAPPQGTNVVVGPGTGLGVGTLLNSGDIRCAAPGEGGHVGIAPGSQSEFEIFEAFRAIWPDVFFGDGLTCEAEAMLSGTGLPYLYRAVQRVMGDTSPPLDARGVLTAAQTNTAPAAGPATDMFKSHLGRVAGDLGLAYGAQNVFLVGGVATKNPWLFDETFVQSFNEGGRFTALRSQMNLYLMRDPDFGLCGARNYAEYMLNRRDAPSQ